MDYRSPGQLPSLSTLRGQEKERSTLGKKLFKLEWNSKTVDRLIMRTMEERIRRSTDYLRDKIIYNISTPVFKAVNNRVIGGQRVVFERRSKPGEFPRADTTRLLHGIKTEYWTSESGVFEGHVFSEVDYGYYLELSDKLDRSFMYRTYLEQLPVIRRIMSNPIKKSR